MIALLPSDAHADPYPAYGRLRETGRMLWQAPGRWVVTGYGEAAEVLGSARFGRGGDAAAAEGGPELLRRLEEAGGELGLGLSPLWLLSHDPPRHTVMRRQLAPALPLRGIEVRPRLAERARALVAGLDGEVDLVAGLAEPLPGMVICDLLGVPEPERPAVLAASRALGRALGGDGRPEALRAAWEATRQLTAAFERQLAAPADGTLLARLQPSPEGIRDDLERVAHAVLMLFAGQETTARFLGNALHALLDQPGALAALRQAPAEVPAAVLELLRFDSPVQLTSRVALEDVVVAGRKVDAGQQVVIALGAANRDPLRFARPDELVFGRRDAGLLAFGRGAHYCLGAPLARWVGEAALGALVADGRPLALLAPPRWRPGEVLRGPEALAARIG
jgi:cytochrome P450